MLARTSDGCPRLDFSCAAIRARVGAGALPLFARRFAYMAFVDVGRAPSSFTSRSSLGRVLAFL